MSDNQWAALAGLLGGVGLGLAGAIGRFCTLGAIEDALYGDDYRRLRMWALAIAVAITGVFILQATGQVDVSSSMYFTLKWNPAASIVGGLMFGWGMALAGNCGYGALTRMAGGDLRSFFTFIIMGIAAYMAIGGPTAALRDMVFPLRPADVELQSFADLLGGWFSVPPIIIAFAVAAGFTIWALWEARFRTSSTHIIWSVVVGLSIISGWWATSLISTTGFDAIAVESHVFVVPLGESLIYLMTWTGSAMNFGIGSVTGVIVGSYIGTLIKGRFRWESCDDVRELGRSVIGAFLMGTGGVLALGCSLGQGLTAFAVLSYSAPVVLASIFMGATLGLRFLIHGFQNT
ncbi:MAG: YeeE/YedE family protein [Paracoccaceae bacterium]